MRDLPADLADRLGGATTLCHCWALTRRDGAVLGFTDHDRDLTLAGVVYAARSGLEAAEASAELGFAVGGGEVAGALSALGLTDADIAGGLYDGAGVETWLVDWTAPETRLLLDAGTLGEVRRAGGAFVAEVRGLMDRLDVPSGRTYRATCAAELGDGRCRVDRDAAAFRTTGRVEAVPEPETLRVALAAPFPDAWFTAGRLVWTGGAQAGHAADIRAHGVDAAGIRLALWQAPARPVQAGDAFTLTAGCDKRFSTCGTKFSNTLNFQGFPHMPGNDFVVRHAPGSGPGLDGGSLFR
ncbi:hypothetical protein PMNALOAF_0326 [Methylobacterium adhaesivum]|uniref:DUF2163 domain-containing protein n=1 Tax=Methylobacterium adhaesivum TaxID=333297 RepID=A0ABT8BFJ7_9HYPH|nr:DUF2163 domain-containing protein [Methylobacterium adhaesivum]MDN3590031.1 DUF2163 domain-containing protein [Methylobacterium adhaesivum]GJD29094.1 hypothetical protein PMNALOAF_0326 [Methylobacterium adhaesivum]